MAIIIVLLAFIKYFEIDRYMLRRLYPKTYSEYVEMASEKYDVAEDLIFAIIKNESNFKNSISSNKGAQGLMQLMDDTANWIAPQVPIENFNVFRIKEPELNIQLGCWYLSYLEQQFDGDLTLIVAAYNAGSGNINKWLSDESYSKDGKTLTSIPYRETKEYVIKIKINQIIYDFLLKVNFYDIEPTI